MKRELKSRARLLAAEARGGPKTRPAEDKGSVKTGPESKNRPANGNWCPDHLQTPGRISKE